MYMAIWIWENWRDIYNIIFVFANTGGEHPLTLKFVDTCAYVWALPIVWVEADINPIKGQGTGFKVVSFETASRDWEPYHDAVNKYGIANKSYRHCNRDLKLEPIHKYAMSVFGGAKFKNYSTAIGIRVDEIDRQDARAKEWNFIYPLIGSKPMRKSDVLDWWKQQVYDLEIPEHYGNCLICFKKSDRKLATIAIERPEWFDTPKYWEIEKSMIGVKDGNPRKIYRSHKTVSDIFAISVSEGFKPYIDDNFIASDSELDIEEPCGHTCSAT